MAATSGDTGKDDPFNLFPKKIDFSADLGISKEFATEDQSNYEKDIQESEELEASLLNPCDRLLTPKERDEIGKLNLEIRPTCPYLEKPEGAEFFFYCRALADTLSRYRKLKFKGLNADPQSAEGRSIRKPTNIEKTCIDNFKTCETYIDFRRNQDTD